MWEKRFFTSQPETHIKNTNEDGIIVLHANKYITLDTTDINVMCNLSVANKARINTLVLPNAGTIELDLPSGTSSTRHSCIYNANDEIYLREYNTDEQSVERGSIKVISVKHLNNQANVYASSILGDGNVNIDGSLFVNYNSKFNGNLYAWAFNTTSDKRLKKNIKSYKCDKSILDLDIKKFDYKEGLSNQIGCLAQDLQKICPEVVTVDERGYLSIQESKIVYLLLDELKKLNNEVKQEVKGLNDRINQLEDK